jgi:hypothetical protein
MSAGAIVMLLVAIVVVWGGLAAAIVNLNRRGLPPSDVSGRDL